MNVISKLADYNNEMEKERTEKLQMKMACDEAEVNATFCYTSVCY